MLLPVPPSPSWVVAILAWQGHRGRGVWRCCFTPLAAAAAPGSAVVTAGADGAVKLWMLDTWLRQRQQQQFQQQQQQQPQDVLMPVVAHFTVNLNLNRAVDQPHPLQCASPPPPSPPPPAAAAAAAAAAALDPTGRQVALAVDSSSSTSSNSRSSSRCVSMADEKIRAVAMPDHNWLLLATNHGCLYAVHVGQATSGSKGSSRSSGQLQAAAANLPAASWLLLYRCQVPGPFLAMKLLPAGGSSSSSSNSQAVVRVRVALGHLRGLAAVVDVVLPSTATL